MNSGFSESMSVTVKRRRWIPYVYRCKARQAVRIPELSSVWGTVWLSSPATRCAEPVASGRTSSAQGCENSMKRASHRFSITFIRRKVSGTLSPPFHLFFFRPSSRDQAPMRRAMQRPQAPQPQQSWRSRKYHRYDVQCTTKSGKNPREYQ